MKPRFALELTQQRIGLLYRTSMGWSRAGKAALEADDLAAELNALRATANALESGGVRTALLLPEDQILFKTVGIDPDSDTPITDQIEAALDGATPYDVADLIYDHRVDGDSAQIAVVARETLDEAESFAKAYKFNPVSFIAASSDPAVFSGIAWFGPTRCALEILADGDAPERETGAMMILGRDPSDTPVAADDAPPDPVAVPTPPAATPAPGDTAPANAPTAAATAGRDIIAPPRGAPQGGVDPQVRYARPRATPHPALSGRAPPPGVEEISVFQGRKARNKGMLRPGTVLLAVFLTFVIAAIGIWAALFSDWRTADRDVELNAPEIGAAPAPDTATAALPDPSVAPDTAAGQDAGPPPRPTARADAPAPAATPPDSLSATDTARAQTGVATPPDAPDDIATTDAAPPRVLARPPSDPASPQAGPAPVYHASIDPLMLPADAVAPPAARTQSPDQALAPMIAPNAPGQTYDLDARGLVVPTPDGALSPGGVLVHSGAPPVPTRLRPFTAEPPPDLTQARLRDLRPTPRPGDLQETNERANLGGFTRSELAQRRPLSRPQSVQERRDAETETTPEEAPVSALALATSKRPLGRPDSLAAQAEQARREASLTPAPAVPAAAAARAPSIPTAASVAKRATDNNAINLRRINLIGVFGSKNDRRALVRLPSGRYLKLKVGDRVDGGRVAAIGDDDLRYTKGGRNIVLEIPQG